MAFPSLYRSGQDSLLCGAIDELLETSYIMSLLWLDTITADVSDLEDSTMSRGLPQSP